MSMEEKVILTGDSGDVWELYVLESTRIAGVDYLLATDAEIGDGDCYILKDVSGSGDAEAVYVPVEDDEELDNLLSVFAELLDDVDLEY